MDSTRHDSLSNFFDFFFLFQQSSRKKCLAIGNGVVCRELANELNESICEAREIVSSKSESNLTSEGIESDAVESEVGADTGRTETGRMGVDVLKAGKNRTRAENASFREVKPERFPIEKKVTCPTQHVNNSTQTDNDLLYAAAKKSLVNVDRKTVSSSASCRSKMGRSLSLSIVSEAKVSSSSNGVASSVKRFAGHVSPRKPEPGRNIEAPAFIPRKKMVTSSSAKLSINNNTKTAMASLSEKTKIFRSRSDTLFETTANDTRVAVSAENVCKSEECVKIVTEKQESPEIVGGYSSSKLASIQPLNAMDETLVPKIVQKDNVETSKKVEENVDDEDERRLSKNSPSNSEARRSNVDCLTKKRLHTTDVAQPTAVDRTSSSSSPPLPEKRAAVTKNTRNTPSSENRCRDIAENSSTRGKEAVSKSDNKSATKERKFESSSVEDKWKREPTGKRAALSNVSATWAIKHIRTGERGKVANANAVGHRTQTAIGKPCVRSANRPITGNANKIEKHSDNKYARVVCENKTNSRTGTNDRDAGDGKTSIQVKQANARAANDGGKSKDCGRERQSPTKPADCYSSIVKSNSFQERFKRDCAKLSNAMIRSKTSIDMKSGNDESHAAIDAIAAAIGDGSHERESPPRHRRSWKDTDGWETVISRSRRSIPNSFNVKCKKFDVNNRFHEPSPSTSLPTLVMVEANGETGAREKPQATFRAKVTETKWRNRNRNNSGSGSTSNNVNSINVSGGGGFGNRETTIQIANDENVIADVCRNYKVSKERPIISNTAMFTTIQPESKKPSERDYRKTKTTKENKGTGRRKSAKESNEHHGTEDSLDEESLRKSKELYEKEISLQKEINDLQNDADLETDADSDSTEVDQEIADLCNNDKIANATERRAVLEAKYSHILTNMTWAEQSETLDKLEELLVRDPSGKSLKSVKNFTSLQQFEEFVTRAPGRALELHQKLSSPSRKRTSPDSTILQHKARQAKAKQNREQLLHDKSAKIRELFNKVCVL